jgi:tetratricopeptide (TPR) repeat protein
MRHQNPITPQSADSQPADPLAEPVRALLTARQWRKARDAAKLLCKRDRARYLPLLIEANIGLTRELFDKGLGAEAEQVLAYLKTIAPPTAFAELDAQLACLRQDKGALRNRALRLLAESKVGPSTTEKARLADDAVLTFAPVSAEGQTLDPLAAELDAVQQSLEALGTRRYDEALNYVRPLARDSAFSHWVRWIKGAIAFYRGDRTRAVRCFAQLPAGSVPARAAAGYRLLIAEPDPNRAPPAKGDLEAACHVLGRPGLASALSKADALWREGKPDDAYDCLRRAIPEFPRAGSDPIGALSDFCFHSLASMTKRQRDRMLRLFERLAFRRKARSDSEWALTVKAVCLEEADAMEPKFLEEKWIEYLKLLNRLHGPDPLRDSLGYAWLGEQLALDVHEAGPLPFFAPPSGPRAGSRAVAALTRAAELDPANVEPQLKLCELHANLGNASDRNRLLDRMTERFPDRKEVLLFAGNGCLERQAFKKGIAYLERARALDPLDPRIPHALAIGRIQRAVDQYRARRLEPARQTWADLNELLIETPHDLTRSRWAILARQGVLERCFGDTAAGESHSAEARAASPSPEAFLFHTHFAQRVYAPNQRGPWLDEFVEVSRKGARVGHAQLLVAICHYWKTSPKDPCLKEEYKLHEYVRQAANRPFTHDEAAGLLFSMPPSPKWSQALKPIIRQVLARDPKDPRFRLFQILSQILPQNTAACRRTVQDLQSIVEEAHRRRFDPIAKAAQSAIQELESRLAHATDFQHAVNDSDLDDEDEIWDPFPGPQPKNGLDLPPLDSTDTTAWEELIRMIATASPGQIKELKRNPPPGMPRDLINLLIRAARAADGMPVPPPFALPPHDDPGPTARRKRATKPAAPHDHPELPF